MRHFEVCSTEPKSSKRAEVPLYSFEKHQRLEESTAIYSPHVLILEGIFALYDPRVMDLMDMKVSAGYTHVVVIMALIRQQIYCEADADTCLSRRSSYSYGQQHEIILLIRFSLSTARC